MFPTAPQNPRVRHSIAIEIIHVSGKIEPGRETERVQRVRAVKQFDTIGCAVVIAIRIAGIGADEAFLEIRQPVRIRI